LDFFRETAPSVWFFFRLFRGNKKLMNLIPSARHAPKKNEKKRGVPFFEVSDDFNYKSKSEICLCSEVGSPKRALGARRIWVSSRRDTHCVAGAPTEVLLLLFTRILFIITPGAPEREQAPPT